MISGSYRSEACLRSGNGGGIWEMDRNPNPDPNPEVRHGGGIWEMSSLTVLNISGSTKLEIPEVILTLTLTLTLAMRIDA